jgi:Plasmid stabilisation system protein.
MTSSKATPPPYDVVYTETAEAEIAEAYDWLSGFSFDSADRWLDGLQTAVLSEAARRAAVPGIRGLAAESASFPDRDIFVLLYQTRGGSPWRVLFDLWDSDEDGHVDTLRVLRLRHGARRRSSTMEEE